MTDAQEAAARNIRGFRSAARMRQIDLADVLHVGQTTVSDIEANRRELTLREVVAVCKALDVTLAELLRGTDTGDLRALGL